MLEGLGRGRQAAQQPGPGCRMLPQPSCLSSTCLSLLWVPCHSRTLERTQQAKGSLLLLLPSHFLGGWASGWKPTCLQQGAAEDAGEAAVYTGVIHATCNYAGVNCVIGNASSFKLSLEYRGLILTIQQRF